MNEVTIVVPSPTFLHCEISCREHCHGARALVFCPFTHFGIEVCSTMVRYTPWWAIIKASQFSACQRNSADSFILSNATLCDFASSQTFKLAQQVWQPLDQGCDPSCWSAHPPPSLANLAHFDTHMQDIKSRTSARPSHDKHLGLKLRATPVARNLVNDLQIRGWMQLIQNVQTNDLPPSISFHLLPSPSISFHLLPSPSTKLRLYLTVASSIPFYLHI